MKFSEFKADPKKECEKIKKENPETYDKVEDLMDKYKNYSQEELIQEFIKESKKQKENGELNSFQIENIKNTLSPYLTDSQKQNLNNLMDMIND